MRGILDELVAEVYANPEDDAPRQIAADALLERSDRRGEWIHLEATEAMRARRVQLGTLGRLLAWAQPL